MTITDEMVERAAKAIWEAADDEVGWAATLGLAATGDAYMRGQVDFVREQARAALTAALEGREKPDAVAWSFAPGQHVEKWTGEALWEGVVVARYLTTKGKERYVVEVQPQGFQMIAVPEQLRAAAIRGEAS